jgi:hypothetical protein
MDKRSAQSKSVAEGADNASSAYDTPAWHKAWKARGWESPPTPPPANPYEDQQLYLYASTLRSKFGFVRFVGLPTQGGPEDTPIQELFVEPALCQQRIDPVSDPEQWPATTPLVEAVIAHPRLVALGDPGSGKSTLISWIVYNLLSRESNPLKDALGALVPITLVLRDLELTGRPIWSDVLAAFVKHPAGQALGSIDRVKTLLERGHAIVLVDGLDEAGDIATRRAISEAVDALMVAFPYARCIITSRVVGYDDAALREQAELPAHGPGASGETSIARWLSRVESLDRREFAGESVFASLFTRDQFFREMITSVGHLSKGSLPPRTAVVSRYYVTPFNDERISLFVRNWHERHETDRSSRSQRVADLLAALDRSHAVKALARIPNMLTMIALVYRVYVQLPDGRAQLYERIAQAYLESIDIARKLPTLGHPLTDMKRWLGYVAFQMQRLRFAEDANVTVVVRDGKPVDADGGRDGGILVSRERLLAWIAFAMQHNGSSRIADIGGSAAAFVDWIARRAGLILPRSEDLFAFTHLSFQEYFAAWFLHEQVMDPGWLADDEDTGPIAAGTNKAALQAATHDIRWQETFVLMFELLGGKGKWPDHIFKSLFPSRDRENEQYKLMLVSSPEQAMQCEHLMARLANDKHVTLSAPLARAAYVRGWEAYAHMFTAVHTFHPWMPAHLGGALLEVNDDGGSPGIDAIADLPASLSFPILALQGVDADAALPRLFKHRDHLQSVRALMVAFSRFSTASIAALTQSPPPLPALQVLDVDAGAFGVDAMKSIAHGPNALSGLKGLRLRRCPLDDACLESLAHPASQLHDLEHLMLDGSFVTNDGALSLCSPESPVVQIRSLDFGSCLVGDRFIRRLCESAECLPRLQDLRIQSEELTDRAIEMLVAPHAKRSQLGWLAMYSAAFTDKALTALVRENSGLANLDTLQLASPQFTAKGIRSLLGLKKSMPFLRSLHVGGTQEVRVALEELRNHPDMVPAGWSLCVY